MRRTLGPDLPSTSATLRNEISARNLARCSAHEHELSYGRTPAVLYAEAEDQSHGNFYPPAYRRILANPGWRERLEKAYTASSRIPHQHARARRELDTATSSDALLMSIFCAPGVLARKPLQALLAVPTRPQLDFGHRTLTPLLGGHQDRTEADLRIRSDHGDLFLEAKLTETGFQSARPALLARYAEFEAVFDASALPRNGRNDFLGYQLIRSILAAQHHGVRFGLVADARRPDLHEAAFRVFAAVQRAELRSRLQLYTWQEIAACVPRPLQRFLADKYGIHAPQRQNGSYASA